jgi:hypothetical protein
MELADLLRVAYRHEITAANADEAFLRVREIAATPLDAAAFHAAIADALATGLILEPVVLPEGALQCHWRLSLTPAGLARARALIGS